jgi:hypothetical protein
MMLMMTQEQDKNIVVCGQQEEEQGLGSDGLYDCLDHNDMLHPIVCYCGILTVPLWLGRMKICSQYGELYVLTIYLWLREKTFCNDQRCGAELDEEIWEQSSMVT